MLLEIRTYRLKPGTIDEFVRVMRDECLPLLNRFGIKVIDCGASLVAENGHEEAYLIRSFQSLTEHRTQEERFYGSNSWLAGPREAIVSKIESYHSVVIDHAERLAAAIEEV